MLVFSSTGARGSNEFYYLYLVDPKTNTLTKVNDFEVIVNPVYDKEHNVIIAYGYAVTNSYTIYKISASNKVVQIGDSFTDDFESEPEELKLRITKLLKHNKPQ